MFPKFCGIEITRTVKKGIQLIKTMIKIGNALLIE